jgi:hypothetical protein
MNSKKEQRSQDVAELISEIIGEMKAELGRNASVNEIEEALLKRQGSIMSRLMQHLVDDQDFPPSRDES